MARIIKYYDGGEWKYATVKDIGEISQLMTTNKTDIVSAINEIYAQGGAVPADLEQQIQSLETITQQNTGSIDSIYTDLGVIDGEITTITTQQTTDSEKIQTLTLEAQTTQTELEQAKQDLLNKAEQTYVDIELSKKLSESQYQTDMIETQAQIDEKLGLASYQADYNALVNDISSKVDVSAFNGVEGRVTDVETSVTNINGELQQKVSSIDYESDVGIDKWLVTRYSSVSSDMAQYNPEYAMLTQSVEQETVELLDGSSITPEASDASIYRLFTNVYTAQAKTIGLNLSYQDSIHVLMNGASIYKNKSNAGAGVTASLSLRRGWNTVEILLGNKDGQPSITFSTTLSTLADKMTTVIGVGDRNEFRLKQAETSITQNSDQIALKATKTELSNLGNRVDNAEAELVVQAGEISTKVSQTEFDGYSQRLNEAESSITQNAESIATKVSQTDFNLLNGKVTDNETSITQMSDAIALKASQTSVDALSGEVDTVNSQLIVQAEEISTKVSQTTFNTELGNTLNQAKDYTDSELTPLSTRMSTAETNITQNNTQISLKATSQEVDVIRTDLGDIVTRVGLAETAITQNADEISLKATKTELNSVAEDVTTVQSQLTVQAGEISTKVSQTDFNSAESRLTDAETTITQNTTAISLKANQADLNVIDGRLTTAETNLTVQSGEISSKVSRSEFNEESFVWEQKHQINTATPANLKEKDDSDILPSYEYSYKVEARIAGTGTNTGAIAYFRAGGTSASPQFTLEKVMEKGTGSNHIKFYIDTDGKPAVSLYDHTNLYTVIVTTTKFAGTTSESLEIDGRLTTAETTITQHDTQIKSKVSQTDFNTLNGRLTTAETTITQQSGQISLKVESTDFNTFKKNSATENSWRLTENKTLSTDGWYRIAMNTGDRAFAKFTIKDIQSGKHSTAIFNSGIHYGNEPTVTLTGYSNYGSQAFTKARIVKKSTYDDVFLEIYVVAPAIISVWCSDNIQSSGWKPVEYSAGEIPTGYTATEFVIDKNNVADATSQNTSKDTAYVNGVASGTITTDISNAKSTITQHSTAISLRVEKSKVVSEINQSPESIKISANKIDITGAVTFSDFATNEKNLLAGGAGIVNYNPYFADWTGTLPYRVNTWTGVTPTKYTGVTMNGGNGLRMNATSAQDCGVSLSSYFKALDNNEYYTVELDFMLLSGTSLSGAGLLLDWGGLTPYRQQVNLRDEITSPQTGKWYTVRKVLKRPSGASGSYTSMGGYLMGNWSGAGDKTTKDMVYDRVEIRVSTQQEIDIYNGKSTWDSASVTANTALSNAGTAQTTANTANTTANSVQSLTNGWKHPSNATYINGGKIYTNSITATQINVSSLSALSANIGTVTAGTISGVSFSSLPIVKQDYIGRRWTEKTDIGVGSVGFKNNATIYTSDNNGKVAVQETTLNNDGLMVYARNDDSGVNSFVSVSGTNIQFGGATSNLVGVGQHFINADGEFSITSDKKLTLESYQEDVEIMSKVVAPQLHLTSSADASGSSTTHGLTIGSLSSTHIKIDNNEVSGFSGSGTSSLNLNPDGGPVQFGYSLGGTNRLSIENGYISQDGYLSPSLQNGWVDYGSSWQTSRYWKDKNGYVHLEGLIKNGTTSAGTTLFVLPSGYRPTGTQIHITFADKVYSCRIDVLDSGTVRLNDTGIGTWISLSGISFYAG